MLVKDANGTKVRVRNGSVFPKGTICEIVACGFVGKTTNRAYCVSTTSNIKGLVEGLKADWFLERDLENIKE